MCHRLETAGCDDANVANRRRALQALQGTRCRRPVMSIHSEPILVAGATGFVASQLVPRLLARGHAVRALARRPYKLHGQAWSQAVEVVAGDVLQPDSLVAAMQGVHTAYYLVHSMTSGQGYTERDRVAARNFARAAAATGVEHIVYLGALADPREELAPHLRSRIDTGAALREGPVPVTEFRVGVIAGPGSISFRMIRRVVELLPIVPGNTWLLHKTQPMAAQNVVDYLVAALDHADCRGRVFEIGGPETTTYAELLLRYARVRGLARGVVVLPRLPVWLMALGIALLTPVQPSIARAIVGGLSNDSQVLHQDALQAFPEVQLVDFSTAARAAIEAAPRRRPGEPRMIGLGWIAATGLR
jgi:uncharacterized protein YbjT (DUF2867 family)